MFSTLYRYIFKELFRIFLLTTVALTVVMSLSSLLEPIQEYGIGPSQVVDLLFCFVPIMLTFVLPIAALFGASLSYGRLAADNEIDAFKASGVSPLTLTFPVFVLAMLVAMANLVLSFHVMPMFVHHSEKSIKADAKQILFRNLQRRGHYRLGSDNTALYADYVDSKKDLLAGVVAVDYRNGKLDKITAVDLAQVTFDSNDTNSEVWITAQKHLQMGSNDSIWAQIDSLSMSARVGSLLEDDINFKRISEMKEIQANPLSFYPIEKRTRETSIRFLTELLLQDIQTKMRDQSSYDLSGPGQHVKIKAQVVKMGTGQNIKLSQNVEIMTWKDNDTSPTTLRCEQITLHLIGNEYNPELALDIGSAINPDTNRATWGSRIPNLRLPPNLEKQVNARTALEDLSLERITQALSSGPSDTLKTLIHDMDREIQNAEAEIQAEIHARLVFGIGCIPMILIGAALGIIKRGGHLLSAFGISFIPALVLLIAIISGKHIQENLGSSQAVSGLGVMWTGLVILFLMAFGFYRRLLKH